MKNFLSLPLRRAALLLGCGAALGLAGCANVGAGVGIGIPVVPGVSLGVGWGTGGPSVGVGTGWGPVGAGVSVDSGGRVYGNAGAGVGVGSGGVSAGVGVGQSVLLHDPDAAPQPSVQQQQPETGYRVVPSSLPVPQPGEVVAP